MKRAPSPWAAFQPGDFRLRGGSGPAAACRPMCTRGFNREGPLTLLQGTGEGCKQPVNVLLQPRQNGNGREGQERRARDGAALASPGLVAARYAAALDSSVLPTIAAWAAASLATGTRYGEQLT